MPLAQVNPGQHVFLYMVPLILIAVVLLCFVNEKPLATTIKRDIIPETLEIDGMTNVRLNEPADTETVSPSVPSNVLRV